jgi:hypothetical protein
MLLNLGLGLQGCVYNSSFREFQQDSVLGVSVGMDRQDARDAILRMPPWRAGGMSVCGDPATRQTWYPSRQMPCREGVEVDSYFDGDASYETIDLFIQDGRVIKMQRRHHVDGVF